MHDSAQDQGAQVDVVVVSYRSADTIGTAVASVRCSRLVRRIIVVDNNPGDGSRSAAVDAGADSVVEPGGNVGYARAVNLGARLGEARLNTLDEVVWRGRGHRPRR